MHQVVDLKVENRVMLKICQRKIIATIDTDAKHMKKNVHIQIRDNCKEHSWDRKKIRSV